MDSNIFQDLFSIFLESGLEFNFHGVDNRCFKISNDERISWIFEVVEDESDGYRSYLETVQLKNDDSLIFFNLPIARIKLSFHETYNRVEYQLIDVETGHVWLEFGTQLIDVETGHVWLEFGTDDLKNYYPVFFFCYEPKQASVF